jgi:uncharacterized UPF0160 family protein
MKNRTQITLVFLIPFLLFSCNEKRDFPKVIKLETQKKTIFVPTLEHKIEKNKNSIYSPTILFAWNEIKKEFDNNISIEKSNIDLKMVNNSKSFINVLEPNEYSTEIEIKDNYIIAKSKFAKSLPFQNKLTSFDKKLIFNHFYVKSFGTFGKDENSKTIEILYYKNDNEFALKLITKNSDNEIIIYRNRKIFNTMNEIIQSLNSKIKVGEKEMSNKNANWKYQFKGDDFVLIPKFAFNLETNYRNIEGNKFKGKNREYFIETFWQQNAFILDEYGAKVKSKAKIMVKSVEYIPEKPKIKNLILNKPFFVILRKKGMTNPYFAMWIENEELMKIEQSVANKM